MLLILSCTVSNGWAQISGYQGKRSVVTYNLMYFPALINPNANDNTGLASFNVNHLLKGEWVLSRKSSFGIQSRFYKSIVDFEDENVIYTATITEPSGRITSNPGSAYQVPFDDGFFGNGPSFDEKGNVSGFSLGMFYRAYTSKSLAPLGNYFQVGLESMSYKVTPIGNSLRNTDYVRIGNNFNAIPTGSTVSLPNVNEDSRWNSLAISFDFGRQRVIFDRLVWNYGIQNSYIIAGEGVSGLQDLFLSDEINGREYDEDQYLATKGRRRLSSMLFLNIYMGVGFLAL